MLKLLSLKRAFKLSPLPNFSRVAHESKVFGLISGLSLTGATKLHYKLKICFFCKIFYKF